MDSLRTTALLGGGPFLVVKGFKSCAITTEMTATATNHRTNA
jgi:hypothetical protein